MESYLRWSRSFLNVNRVRCQHPALHKQLGARDLVQTKMSISVRNVRTEGLMPCCWDEALSNDLMIAMLWTLHWRIFSLLNNCRLCPEVWTLHPVLSTFLRLILWLASMLSKLGQEQLKNRLPNTPVRVAQNLQARCTIHTNYRVPVIFNVWTINILAISAEACGASVHTPCEKLSKLSVVHQVTTMPRVSGSASVLWCCVLDHANPNWPCIQVSLNQLESDHSLPQTTGLSVDEICSPLSLCLNATYLTFEGESTTRSMVEPNVNVEDFGRLSAS